jgi:hypothetical protein
VRNNSCKLDECQNLGPMKHRYVKINPRFFAAVKISSYTPSPQPTLQRKAKPSLPRRTKNCVSWGGGEPISLTSKSIAFFIPFCSLRRPQMMRQCKVGPNNHYVTTPQQPQTSLPQQSPHNIIHAA